ncbi:hypothetical protein [Actinomadura sp. WMMB 499]|uniref:hypothetical protein n=1 Tax=Actinomadura sp. WMMB 499 TaxID=1219491 RepID=UPI0012478EB7|nr:hypothetical protein [Actinomadura sp. WMMB 499]QFG22914.1 hypothetical protein F7P10_19130 [Actinomadura sp. WMMB 499]
MSGKYGFERNPAVVSWRTLLQEQIEREGASRTYDYMDQPPAQDHVAAEMHRLRGLVMAQGTETESVLREIVKCLESNLNIEKSTARRLTKDIRRLLSGDDEAFWEYELCLIEEAIDRRNHAVHSEVVIGSSWEDYTTGGGEWVPVIGLLGKEQYDEVDLQKDFTLQWHATQAAVAILLT